MISKNISLSSPPWSTIKRRFLLFSDCMQSVWAYNTIQSAKNLFRENAMVSPPAVIMNTTIFLLIRTKTPYSRLYIYYLDNIENNLSKYNFPHKVPLKWTNSENGMDGRACDNNRHSSSSLPQHFWIYNTMMVVHFNCTLMYMALLSAKAKGRNRARKSQHVILRKGRSIYSCRWNSSSAKKKKTHRNVDVSYVCLHMGYDWMTISIQQL